MPNFVNEEAIAACAERIVAAIPQPGVAARLNTLFIGALKDDARNARRARPADLWNGPGWALEALAQGLPCDVFHASSAMMQHLTLVAAHVRDACIDMAANENGGGPHALALKTRAARLIGKLDRMSLADVAAQAKELARTRRAAQRELAEEKDWGAALYAAESVPAKIGRAWRRVVSIAELHKLGEALDNCLRRDRPQHPRYAQMLRSDEAQFWALYEGKTPIAAAMSFTILQCVHEVRGPRNARVSPKDPDLRALLRGKGLMLTLYLMDTQHRVTEAMIDDVLRILGAEAA